MSKVSCVADIIEGQVMPLYDLRANEVSYLEQLQND